VYQNLLQFLSSFRRFILKDQLKKITFAIAYKWWLYWDFVFYIHIVGREACAEHFVEVNPVFHPEIRALSLLIGLFLWTEN